MKYLPSILAVVMAALGVFSADVQHAVMAHPAIASVLGAIGAILAHLAPQPQK